MADMRYRRLGRCGLVVSVVGLGCNNFGRRVDAAGTAAVIDAAIDAGINLFDTADLYGSHPGESEEFIGAAFKRNGHRDNVILATKFGYPLDQAHSRDGLGGRRYIRTAVEASLRRLGTDFIDLYQLHLPDQLTPIDETLAALDELVRAGKVRYIGSSNFAGWQVADAAWTAQTHHLTPFVSAQNEYSLLRRGVEAELVPACQRFGVGILPYFPLASGLLTGKYRKGEAAPSGSRLDSARFAGVLDQARWGAVEGLESFAHERGLSILDVAIGGLAAKLGVASVIAGATTAEQVRANAAAGAWEPTTAELAEIDEITAE